MRVKYSFSSRRTRNLENIRKQREKYPSIAKNILAVSDIILEVLDARFVSETRNLAIEKEIKERGKRIIYVLNKSDLISLPKLRRLSKELTPNVAVSCKLRKGIKELRDKIKIEARKVEKKEMKFIKGQEIKKSEGEQISVGVIGYPNTGKSSLINSLIGKKSAGTAAEAGFTKGIQKLRLTSDIILLDSPGVIPESEYSGINKEAIAKHTKVGGRSYTQVKDPENVVAELMKEFPGIFEEFYNIEAKGDSEVLLEELGRQKGILKKEGKVNEDQTARVILKDWQEGRIPLREEN